MIVILVLLSSAVIHSYSDVIRTVYCKNQCTDYLGIPENSMPLCAPEHLKLKECGTVITCDWAEAERDKVRPMANSTFDMLCCYRTTIKEKGDCGDATAVLEPHTDSVYEPVIVSDLCTIHFLPWLLCIVLLVVVTLQAVYIVKLSISSPSRQKITQSDGPNFPQMVISQPLIDTRLLGTTAVHE